MISANTHETSKKRSYQNLSTARLNAEEYDSTTTRAQISNIFTTRFGKPPYDWQLDVTEAAILGLDCVVIAGTGMGKTMPFMMPLLHKPTAKSIFISPLKVLQEDQAARFNAMGISAVAVNGDTWSLELKKVYTCIEEFEV